LFKHEKQLLEIVKIERPNPTYATLLLEQVETHVLTGLAPNLTNASGVPWTSAYVTVTGDLPDSITPLP